MALLQASLFVVVTYQVSANDGWFGRTWQSNLNYNNSRNWKTGRVPCDADRVVLQRTESIVLEIPEGKTSLRGLMMSSYTEILLPKDGVIHFSGKTVSPSCDGQDAVFKPTRASLWTDPHHWDQWSPATPDLERVPCTLEAVRFPTGSIFRIQMPDIVKLGSFEINQVTMDSSDWFKFVILDEGVHQFFKSNGDPADLEINGFTCPPSQWCECGNEYLHSEICTAACPVAPCQLPVQPSGFCCPICGAYFLLKDSSQNKENLTDHINSFLRDKDIAWHASKVRGSIQVVLVEEQEYTGQVPEVADNLRTFLINSGMGWIAQEFHSSGHVWYPTTFGQVVGHFLTLMVLAVTTIAVIVVYYSQNWSWLHMSSPEGRPFVFARFENQSGEVVVASEQTQHSPTLPQAFDNPMYGATDQDQRNITEESPIYTELNEASKSRQQIEEGIVLHSTDFSTH